MENETKKKLKLDHRCHISHIKDQISGLSYTLLSQRRILPSYVQMEKRDGPKKPERPKLYPSKEIISCHISNGKVVWGGEIDFEQHNITRQRPGGLNETWNEDIFFQEVQTAIQYPSINKTFFQLRPLQESNFNLEVKARKADVVVNYIKPCQLAQLEEVDCQTILERIELEEIALINFFCSRGILEKVQFYYEGRSGQVDLNYLEKGSWAPIQRASYSGSEDIVRYLIENGANVNIKSDDGMDPLYCAIKGGHQRIVELLIDSGAEVTFDEPGSEREGHLGYATTCRQREIVRYLTQPGGQIQLRLDALNGTRKSGKPDPPRFFTTLDGYPVEHTSIQIEDSKKKDDKKQKKKHHHATSHAHQTHHHTPTTHKKSR